MTQRILKEIMPTDEINTLIKAFANGEDYNYDKNGLKVEFTNNGSNCNLTINYSNPIEDEKQAFTDFCESLDDKLFVDVCEELGEDNLQRVQDCLDSNNIDSIRSSVNYFKSNVKEVINNKIKALQDTLARI